jgi:hypothetical protein
MAHAALVLATATAVAAEEDAPPPPPAYRLESILSAGYRMVDIDGSRDKYREDYDLRSGGRLFEVGVSGRASDPDATWVDRFHLEVDTPHDEPVSRFRFSASDVRRYELRASWVRSTYFYEVPRLFEAPVPGDVRLDDLHDFDTRRSDGVVDLRVRVTDRVALLAGYRLYERFGDAVSTVFAPGGDTFLVRAPIDTTTHVGRLAADAAVLGGRLFLQQEYRRVGRRLDRHGPDDLGAAGVDPTDASTLTRYEVDQDETVDAPRTTVRVERPLGERGELTGVYLYQHAETDAERTALLDATRNVGGVPTLARSAGEADASSDTHVADIGTSWRLTERVSVHGGYRFDAQQQSGRLREVGTAGLLDVETDDRIRIHRVTGEVEVVPRDDLRLRAGMRFARRDADVSIATRDVTTDLIGAVADVRYRPWSPLQLFARYESAQIDDPYTSASAPLATPGLPEREIALTFVNRASAGFRWRAASWAHLHYAFLADSRENASFDARSSGYGNNVALALEPRSDLSVYLAYTRRDLDNRADILIAPTYRPVTSLQDGSEDVVTAQFTWAFALVGARWSTGANLIYVASDQHLGPQLEPELRGRTAFDLDRIDGGAFLTLHHAWVEPTLEFRMIDYDERMFPQNDYRATIVMVKLTRRWSR